MRLPETSTQACPAADADPARPSIATAGVSRRLGGRVTAPDTVAAIDLGSNSVHMVVARVGGDGEVHVVDRLKRTVRMAAGLDEEGNLDESARERALEALTQMGERVAAMPPQAVRVVGTNTLRRARNSGALLEAAEAAVGHPIEIISGHEEARLIYGGVRHDRPPEGRRLVVDIGGGSTELIIGEDTEPAMLDSRFMGCVSRSMRFFPDGRISKKRFQKAITAARVGLDSIARNYIAMGWDEAVGSSGTINAVEKVLMETGLGPDGITSDALDRLRREFIRLGHTDALELPGLSERRRAVTAMVRRADRRVELRHPLHEASQSARRRRSTTSGVSRPPDVREKTIERLAEQHVVDPAHAARVDPVVTLFERVHAAWELHPTGPCPAAGRPASTSASRSRTTALQARRLPPAARGSPGLLSPGTEHPRRIGARPAGKLDRDRITAVYTGPLEPVLHLAVVPGSHGASTAPGPPAWCRCPRWKPHPGGCG